MSLMSDYLERRLLEEVFRDGPLPGPVSMEVGLVAETTIGTYLEHLELWLEANPDQHLCGLPQGTIAGQKIEDFVERIAQQLTIENHPRAMLLHDLGLLIGTNSIRVDYGPYLGAGKVDSIEEGRFRLAQEAHRRLLELRGVQPATVTHGPYGQPIGVLRRPKPVQPIVKEAKLPNRRSIILE